MTLQIDEPEVLYPDSDGQPMADNTRQFDWIVTIKSGLETLFRHDPNVFVAGDLLWYPVRGSNLIRMAPDALIAFGRPKGPRGSYKQWEEGGIAPQVVFEVLSPGNTRVEMANKRTWYSRYGVEEYYEYDPDRGQLRGWLSEGNALAPIATMSGWVSPRLGVQFGLEGVDLVLMAPDGERFLSYLEQVQARERAEIGEHYQKLRAEQERMRAEQERERAEQERMRAEQERMRAEQERMRAEQERERAIAADERAQRLAARLRELGLSEE